MCVSSLCKDLLTLTGPCRVCWPGHRCVCGDSIVRTFPTRFTNNGSKGQVRGTEGLVPSNVDVVWSGGHDMESNYKQNY